MNLVSTVKIQHDHAWFLAYCFMNYVRDCIKYSVIVIFTGQRSDLIETFFLLLND